MDSFCKTSTFGLKCVGYLQHSQWTTERQTNIFTVKTETTGRFTEYDNGSETQCYLETFSTNNLKWNTRRMIYKQNVESAIEAGIPVGRVMYRTKGIRTTTKIIGSSYFPETR